MERTEISYRTANSQAQRHTSVIAALWEVEVEGIICAQEFETSLGNMTKPRLYKKIQKLAYSPSYSGG